MFECIKCENKEYFILSEEIDNEKIICCSSCGLKYKKQGDNFISLNKGPLDK